MQATRTTVRATRRTPSLWKTAGLGWKAAGLGLTALAVSGLLAAYPQAARAQDLVTNGGFETGDFTGWTVGGPARTASVDAGAGVGGSYAASFAATDPANPATLSQGLVTTAGTTYTITFAAQTPEYGGAFSPTGQPNRLLVFFGGVRLDAIDVPDGGFIQYVYTARATSPRTMLEFDITNQPDFTQLDNIRVTPSAVAAVPEPSSLAAFAFTGLGAAALALRVRRCRSPRP